MNTPDKKGIKAFAKEYGCTALYSGKERTMYIHGANEVACVLAIKNYHYTRFSVVAGNHIYKQ